MRKKAVLGVAAVLFLLCTTGATFLASVITPYAVKIHCSEYFVAGRDMDAIRSSDFKTVLAMVKLDGLLGPFMVSADDNAKTVRASLLGLGGRTAYYQPGYGCAIGKMDGAPFPPVPPYRGGFVQKTALAGSPEAIDRVDYQALERALSGAIANTAQGHRAFVVLVDGALVGEAYAPGFSAETPLISQSMAKSVNATILGAAILQGLVDLDDPIDAPEWSNGDPRTDITYRHLVTMTSGLDFREEFAPRQDGAVMLNSKDMGAFVASKQLAHAPGERFYYSSGDSNLLSRSLARKLRANGDGLNVFAQKAIFEPLNVDFELEADASGAFVGSSFAYAPARHWARLGQLYLQDGVWEGERLLPEGWTDWVREITPGSDNKYGAGLWLNHAAESTGELFWSGAPESMYFMAGVLGQFVFISPSKNAVVVRLGVSPDYMSSVEPVLAEIMAAIDSKASR